MKPVFQTSFLHLCFYANLSPYPAVFRKAASPTVKKKILPSPKKQTPTWNGCTSPGGCLGGYSHSSLPACGGGAAGGKAAPDGVRGKFSELVRTAAMCLRICGGRDCWIGAFPWPPPWRPPAPPRGLPPETAPKEAAENGLFCYLIDRENLPLFSHYSINSYPNAPCHGAALSAYLSCKL